MNLLLKCREVASKTGAEIELTDDIKIGAKDADVLYTDIWLSMGEPEEIMGAKNQALTSLPG